MEHVAPSDREAQHPVDGVTLTPLAVGERMSMNTGRLEPGATVPEHSHHHEQIGYVISGELTLIVDGDAVTLGPGESFALESNEPHAAENRGDEPAIAVDIFSPPRHHADWE